MSAAISTPQKREVLVGSVWRRQDPSGSWTTFEVQSIAFNPYRQKCAKGKTASKKIITCNLQAMESGDTRYEHVHNDHVRKAGS